MKKILSAFFVVVLALNFISANSYPEYNLCQKIMGKPKIKNPELKIILGSKINKNPEADLISLKKRLRDSFTLAKLGPEYFAEGQKYWILYQKEKSGYQRIIAGADLFLPEEPGLRYYLLEFTFTGEDFSQIIGGKIQKSERYGENLVILGYTPELNTAIMVNGKKINYELIITRKSGGAAVKLGIPMWLGNF